MADNKMLKALKQQGFTVEQTRKGRTMVRDANGDFVAVLAGNAKDHRSWRNALAALRRAGFVWPPPR